VLLQLHQLLLQQSSILLLQVAGKVAAVMAVAVVEVEAQVVLEQQQDLPLHLALH
jgi:hypothetical protein